MKKLFLDMDGVLVDWLRGAHELHDLPWNGVNWLYKRGPEGWDFYKELGLSLDELFTGMGFDFWGNLDWMSDGKEILTICEKYFGNNIFLLTNPYMTSGAIDGRQSWIERNMPKYREKVLYGSRKYVYASTDAILLDDYDKNINEWRDAGGYGILLPRPWNTLEDCICASSWYVTQVFERLL